VVQLEVTAPKHDVIHSWWVPALGGKIDAIPGKVNETWFQVDKEGLYRGQCAELCGVQHAAMLNAVEVLPQAEYNRWLEEQAGEQENPRGDTALGRATYRAVCAKCHGFRREGLIGPPLTEAAVSNTEALKQLFEEGRGQMPPVGKGWHEAQVDAVISYLQSGSQGGG
jgi:cytochrome c oxidase subunit 2